jgi:hypothetical protein
MQAAEVGGAHGPSLDRGGQTTSGPAGSRGVDFYALEDGVIPMEPRLGSARLGVMTRSSPMTPRGILSLPLSTRRRRALAAIEAVVGLNAIGGMAYALGGAKDVPPEWLDGTPFGSYVVPGLYLGVVVGGSCLAAAYAAARDDRRARAAALASSAAMVSWIAAQVAMIGYRSPLQPIIAGTGAAVAYLAARR